MNIEKNLENIAEGLILPIKEICHTLVIQKKNLELILNAVLSSKTKNQSKIME